jgi:16S rRNA (guanine966-N2)-methyltransferase
MRIIGGKYKGKKLIQPLDKTTRPLKDLVKESIFNIIQHSNKIDIQIENSKILDLYAGSGSFGIECISRDAKLVYFFEKHLNAIKILNQNINSLKENSNYKLFEKDCLDFLASDSFTTKNFNIIFLDPPFKEDTLNKILNLILSKNILKDNGLIIIHRHIKDKIKIIDELEIVEDRKYGISRIFFCKKLKFL